jgi:hypothetical protein
MNEEILHRLFQVVIYTGGIVSFWQITKHMPKVFYTTLECISVMVCTVLLAMPIVALLEYILGGNIDTTMMFAGVLASVGFLCAIWMFMVQCGRELQGKQQYKHLVM